MHTSSNYAEAFNWVQLNSHAETHPVIDISACGIMNEALVRDAAGTPPTAPGYQPTWNLPWAVALVYERKADSLAADTTGRVTSFTSEGSTVTRDGGATAADFLAAAKRWKAKATGSGGLTVIELGGATPAPVPRSAHYGITTDTTMRGSRAH
ncbi:hypothetical protein [Rothia nasimurium]|uniref:hypothetical protein n=1 Tax=Rothia nasimurium TaxID=85336 RepID=UPI001F2AC08F|nr:hypothetical protein [Rothia nasimurium]